MMNRKILLMALLFSFAAHLAIAAVIVYIPYDMIGNSLAGHKDRVIWGYVKGGEKSAKIGKVTHAINPVQQDKMIPEGDTIPPPGHMNGVDSDDPVISLDSQMNIKIPLNPPFSKGDMLYPPLEKGGMGGFETENTLPALIVAENGLAEGQKGETGVISLQSDGSDTGNKNICNTSEDCESVTLSNGNQGSKRFDMHALAEHVRKEIERYKYYPDLAKLKGIEGTVYINFYIGQDGIPSSISVARSSGSRILDDAGINTIGMVGKFSKLHKDMRELDIVVPITYKLENSDK